MHAAVVHNVLQGYLAHKKTRRGWARLGRTRSGMQPNSNENLEYWEPQCGFNTTHQSTRPRERRAEMHATVVQGYLAHKKTPSPRTLQ